MPLVTLSYNSDRVLPVMARQLARTLPKLVAEVFSIEGDQVAQLAPSEVEVWVRKYSPLDVNTTDLGIIVRANSYPARLQNLEKSRLLLLGRIREFLGDFDQNLDGYVWILLSEGSFGEL